MSEKAPNFEAALAQARIEDAHEKQEKKELPRTPESAVDLHTKEVFSGSLGHVNEGLGGQIKAMEPLITDLAEKSMSYFDTLKADNYLLLMTQGETFTHLEYQAFQEYQNTLKTRVSTVKFVSHMLASGETWENIMKRGEMRSFLTTPEGKFMTRISEFSPNIEEAKKEFHFNKAQELAGNPQLGRNGKLFAEVYCDALKGTEYEERARQFCPSKVEKFSDGSRELARELLSLDQLFIMATSGLVGRGIATGISGSEKAVRYSTKALDTINASKYAKATLPGAEVFISSVTDGKAKKVLKIAGNIAIDLSKFAAYESLAKQTGNEEVAKAVAMILVFIPGAKAGFESKLRQNPMANAESALKFGDWMIAERGEVNLREDLYKALVEKFKQEKSGKGSSAEAMPNNELSKETNETLRIMADDAVRLLKTAREGGQVNSESRVIERLHGKIDKGNRTTEDIYEKLNDVGPLRLKEYKHPVTGEKISSVTKESYLPAYREGLSKLGGLLEDVRDWTLMSSNTLFLTVGKFKTLPGDLDVIVRSEDFKHIYSKFQTLEKSGKLGGLTLKSIDGSVPHVTPENTEELLKAGNLKLQFYLETSQKIPGKGGSLLMDTELFFDAKGKGLIQLGEIPRVLETFTLDGKKIKTLSPYDSIETYTYNLLDENGKNVIDQFGKAKDATRVNNLLVYLQEAGMTKPEDILKKIDDTVLKYRKYAGPELSKNFEKVFEGKDRVKAEIKGMIGKFNDRIRQNKQRGESVGSLPEFENFIEKTDKQKEKMREWYNKAIDGGITPEEKEKAHKMIESMKSERNQNLKLMKTSEDFAYFYEYDILDKRFIDRLQDVLK
ncbi:MAG: hypothetical protein PHH16_00710 [Candidatus Gracilibacteria bacterium]|nr:hypothetical protein [Candidatus Gracilibacteria bacterium]